MKRHYLICAIAVSVTLMAAALPLSAQAVPLTLPPRPSPEPTVVYLPAGVGGGFIELRIQSGQSPAKLWTTVQWQNQRGHWYTVEGWQGTPFEDGRVLWWVQHVTSGEARYFREWATLIAALQEMLKTSEV